MAKRDTTTPGGTVPGSTERRLLSLLISYPEIFPKVSGVLSEDHFFYESSRKIFGDMLHLSTINKPITISNLVSSGSEMGTIESLISGEQFIPDDIDLIVDLMIYEYQLRKYEEAGMSLAMGAKTGDVDVCLGILEDARKIVENTYNQEDEREAVIHALSELEKKKKRKEEHPDAIFGVRTGFPDLDKITGGFQGGDLIILGARPSVGKTALSLHMANQTSSLFGTKVGMISIEMDKISIINRQLSWISGVNSESIRDAQYQDGEWELVQEAAKKRYDLPFYIDDRSTTVSQVVGSALRLKSKYDIDLLIIDYLQMMKGISKEKRIEVGDNALACKQIAKTLGIPVILLSQLSRFKTTKPTMSDLRESGDIEAHADLIFLLWNNKDEGYMEIDLQKHRNGGLATLFKNPKKEIGFFYDINAYGTRDTYSKSVHENDIPF